jgi:hypothetical protein
VVHNNIEFSVQEREAGIWRWEYTIGELIKSGELVVSTRVVASRKVRQQIDRDLRILYRSQRQRGIRFWGIFQLWARSAARRCCIFRADSEPGFRSQHSWLLSLIGHRSGERGIVMATWMFGAGMARWAGEGVHPAMQAGCLISG